MTRVKIVGGMWGGEHWACQTCQRRAWRPGGAIFFARRGWMDWRYPLAEAPQPLVRFPSEQPVRICRCGRDVHCVRVTYNTTNGIPSGTDREYACACGVRFNIENGWGTAVSIVGAVVLTLLGLSAFVWLDDVGWVGIGGGCVAILIGGVLLYSAVQNLRMLRRFPYAGPRASD